MINKFINYLAFITIFVAAMSLFALKEKVALLNYQLIEIVKQIKEEKDKIHNLKAEFALLNNPDRLRAINANYLKLSSLKPDQLVKDPLEQQDIVSKGVASVNKDVMSLNSKTNIKWRYKKMPGKYANNIQTVSSRIR